MLGSLVRGPLELVKVIGLANRAASVEPLGPMSTPARTPQFGPGTGSGRRPIPGDLYLSRWRPVVESLKSGSSTAEIKRKHGTCGETVRRVRRIMMDQGWAPVKRVPEKVVRPVREPRPPRLGMTPGQRLQKHPGVAFWLQAGRTMKQVAAVEGVSVNTVRVVKRALRGSH